MSTSNIINILMIKISNTTEELINEIGRLDGFANGESALKGLGFYEFNLSDLGFPGHDQLLQSTLEIENSVGLIGWQSNGRESTVYKGFSLTYNPDFYIPNFSVYHQTWGDKNLMQNYGKQKGMMSRRKNTYYDSYSFRLVPDLVAEKYNPLLSRLSMPLIRSRVAYIFPSKELSSFDSWHVDEFPYQVLRINIPLQTSAEHVLDIKGQDEYGNELEILEKHLEVGKAYIWNTRIPHRIRALNKNFTQPRIHIVLGMSPWFAYDRENDEYIKSRYYGQSIKDIIDQMLFLNH